MIVILTLTVLVHQLQLHCSSDEQCYNNSTLNGEGGAGYPVKRFPIGYRGGVWKLPKWRSTQLPKPDRPKFTPYIGARSLTNIDKFFELLRENLDAILREKGSPGSKFSRKEESGSKLPKTSNFIRPAWHIPIQGLGKRQI